MKNASYADFGPRVPLLAAISANVMPQPPFVTPALRFVTPR